MRGAWCALGFVALAVGCAPPACHERPARLLCPLGTSCGSHTDCASRACIGGACTFVCDDASDCPAGQACIDPPFASQPRSCSRECPDGFRYVGAHSGLVCVGGAIVACGAAGTSGLCDGCGCSAVGEVCLGASTPCTVAHACVCAPPLGNGMPCALDLECASENCGLNAALSLACQPAPGAPCDGTCALCDLPDASGASTCRRTCAIDRPCASGLCTRVGSSVPGCYVECTADARVCTPHEQCIAPPDDFTGRRVCVMQ